MSKVAESNPRRSQWPWRSCRLSRLRGAEHTSCRQAVIVLRLSCGPIYTTVYIVENVESGDRVSGLYSIHSKMYRED